MQPDTHVLPAVHLPAELPAQAPAQVCVRDALFLLAHDPDRGFEPRLCPPVLELGLAAATLVDLIILGRVRPSVRPDRVYPVGDQPIADVIAQTAHHTLRSHTPPRYEDEKGHLVYPSLGIADVLTVLEQDLTDRTRAHLVACGILVPRKRRLGRVRYVPATTMTMALGIAAARPILTDPRIYDGNGLAVCALVQALDLHDALYLTDRSHLDPQITTRIDEMRAMAPPWNSIPIIAGILRQARDERIVGVYG